VKCSASLDGVWRQSPNGIQRQIKPLVRDQGASPSEAEQFYLFIYYEFVLKAQEKKKAKAYNHKK
jgi:hypothetical protein